MTRLGFDPWREAAQLSDLPRETAARVFAVTIAMLPEGDWKASESEAIAARLVKCLPGRGTEVFPSMRDGRAAGTALAVSGVIESRAGALLIWTVLAGAVLFDQRLDMGHSTAVSTQQ